MKTTKTIDDAYGEIEVSYDPRFVGKALIRWHKGMRRDGATIPAAALKAIYTQGVEDEREAESLRQSAEAAEAKESQLEAQRYPRDPLADLPLFMIVPNDPSDA